MSIANYFNKLPKDAPLPISWKASAETPTKQTKRGPGQPRKTSDSPLTVQNVSSSSIDTANRLCSFPDSLTVCCFFSYMRCPYFLIHVVSSDDPRRLKGTWDCCCHFLCHLSLPTMSRPHRECALALYIIGERQR